MRRIRMLANHGRLEKYTHAFEGVSSRLDGLQAAVLRVKLRHLDAWNKSRQQHAQRYRELLRGGSVLLPAVNSNAEPVWHLFVVRVENREHAQALLNAKGIATGVHYPIPLHRQPAYQSLGIPEGAFPITEDAARRVLSLPMYPELTEDQVAAVSRVVGGTAA
jgi:dTDP-4-amino-4,6-dideoxygalactose transaminase